MKYKNEGITLISVIVTIIILLILAGISIQMLTGQNRHIKQSRRGKNKNKRKSRVRRSSISSNKCFNQWKIKNNNF